MRRLLVLLSCLAASPALLFAQKNDPHFMTPRIAPVAQRSAFVHGYLHGYEEGFHQADFDLQMGRIAHGQFTHDPSPTGYRKQFGPRQMYESGYHNGFRVGYADAAAGRSFRALQNVEAGFSDQTSPATGATLEEGVQSGYLAGQHQGLEDARRQVESHPAPACPVSSGKTQQEFCSAYASGYGMGYSDGYTNQTKTTVAEAKN